MANEISVTIRATLQNSPVDDSFNEAIKVDQATKNISKQIHNVTTGDAAIPLGTISTLGWLFLINTDGTNFVNHGPDSAGSLVPYGQLLPGETAALRLVPGITPRWQADTATCKVLAVFWEK